MTLSQIEALLKKWREQAERHKKHGDSYRIGQGWGMVQCADELDALLASLREAGAEPTEQPKKCYSCGKPATCIGSYEGHDVDPQASCDDCCGHGNEDGYCKPIGEATGDPAPPVEKD